VACLHLGTSMSGSGFFAAPWVAGVAIVNDETGGDMVGRSGTRLGRRGGGAIRRQERESVGEGYFDLIVAWQGRAMGR